MTLFQPFHLFLPDQGLVRFRIEVAPDGKIAKVEELRSTSEVATYDDDAQGQG